MISTILQGGLGNQMFQIAAAYSLAQKVQTNLIVDPSKHYLPLQGNNCLAYKNNIFKNIKFDFIENYNNKFELFEENGFNIPLKDNLILKGYFQSINYFEDNKDDIIDMFRPTNEIKKYIFDKYGNITKKISVHVRRGDYLKFPDIHPACDEKYYKNAISNFKNDNFIIFSDDIEWVENNFTDINFTTIKDKDYIELYMMSMCKANIIADSTFSWWGTFLNKDKEICIAPKLWFGENGPKKTDLLLKNFLIL